MANQSTEQVQVRGRLTPRMMKFPSSLRRQMLSERWGRGVWCLGGLALGLGMFGLGQSGFGGFFVNAALMALGAMLVLATLCLGFDSVVLPVVSGPRWQLRQWRKEGVFAWEHLWLMGPDGVKHAVLDASGRGKGIQSHMPWSVWTKVWEDKAGLNMLDKQGVTRCLPWAFFSSPTDVKLVVGWWEAGFEKTNPTLAPTTSGAGVAGAGEARAAVDGMRWSGDLSLKELAEACWMVLRWRSLKQGLLGRVVSVGVHTCNVLIVLLAAWLGASLGGWVWGFVVALAFVLFELAFVFVGFVLTGNLGCLQRRRLADNLRGKVDEGAVTIGFAEEGPWSVSESGQHRFTWAMFHGALPTRVGLCVWSQSGSVLLVPRDWFADEQAFKQATLFALRRVGSCPKCAYPYGGSDSPACVECGQVFQAPPVLLAFGFLRELLRWPKLKTFD